MKLDQVISQVLEEAKSRTPEEFLTKHTAELDKLTKQLVKKTADWKKLAKKKDLTWRDATDDIVVAIENLRDVIYRL